jgi:NADH-ubiquinone oxidoreductase chain 3
MSSITFYLILIPFLSFILLGLNLLLGPHNPSQEKSSAFECGFSSFLGQNRSQFSISFFIFAILFLIFDLEILLIYPYVVSGYNNEIYGLIVIVILLLVLTAGFVFEIGRGALKIYSRQISNLKNVQVEYLDNITKTSLLLQK